MGKCSNGFRPIPRPRALHGKSRPGLPSLKNADRTATPKHLRSLPNCWAGFPKPGKTSKPGSNSANSMTTSALEEKRKSHILKIRKIKTREKHMSNNIGQKLAGKIAVITGGNSGIGLATAKRFVEEGAHVVITGRREKDLKEAAAFIGRNVTTVAGDVSRLEDLDQLYAVVKEKHGHIDILFANAGGGTVAPLGAKFVKGFNHLAAAPPAADPIVEGGHRVVFLSSDDDDAIAPVADLAKQLGFAPVELGKLNEGGALVHARGGTWGQLIFQDLFKKEQ